MSIRTDIIKPCKLFLRAGYPLYITLLRMPTKAPPCALTASNCRRQAHILAYIITSPKALGPWSAGHCRRCDTRGPWSVVREVLPVGRWPMLAVTNLNVSKYSLTFKLACPARRFLSTLEGLGPFLMLPYRAPCGYPVRFLWIRCG